VRLPPPSTLFPTRRSSDLFHFPWSGADAAGTTITTALALLFDRQMGLLSYTPVLLLAVVGAIVLWRSNRPADRRLLSALALVVRSEEHTSELQSPCNLVCR